MKKKKMDRNAAVLEMNRQMKFGKETSNYEKKLRDDAAPELVLFLQESKYHFVTDISMDADSDHQFNPENKQRLLFKSAKWKHKSTDGSSSSTSLTLDLDCTHKQIDHPDEPVLLHSHHHTRKGVRVNREAVYGSSSSMRRFSTTEGGYISEASASASASSMYRSDSLATMGSCSRKGRSGSSVDEIRFSDFSASFWGRSAAIRGFSGDVSLSSTSSNASTHSFAFPVLPAEWNGSPVRMAVADPRQLRKQRSWKTSLLCCRF